MKITIGHITLPLLALASGLALVYAGGPLGWGLTWIMAGAFFITIGVATGLLTLAWILPGPVGAFLRSPAVSIFLALAVLGMMIATVLSAIL